MKKLIFTLAIASFGLATAQQTPEKACCKNKKECKMSNKKECSTKDKKACATHKNCK